MSSPRTWLFIHVRYVPYEDECERLLATLGKDAAPFSGTQGGPPKTGQCFIAIHPGATSGGHFGTRMSDLIAAIRAQEGAHLQGDGRRAKRAEAKRSGVAVNTATLDKIAAIVN